jgi:hypothetical protein
MNINNQTQTYIFLYFHSTAINMSKILSFHQYWFYSDVQFSIIKYQILKS